MIQILSFRLRAAVDEATFLAADRRVQMEFAYHQPGLLRRTTARGDDGLWVVINLWQSEADADAAVERWAGDPMTEEFMSLIDVSTVQAQRFATLD